MDKLVSLTCVYVLTLKVMAATESMSSVESKLLETVSRQKNARSSLEYLHVIWLSWHLLHTRAIVCANLQRIFSHQYIFLRVPDKI